MPPKSPNITVSHEVVSPPPSAAPLSPCMSQQWTISVCRLLTTPCQRRRDSASQRSHPWVISVCLIADMSMVIDVAELPPPAHLPTTCVFNVPFMLSTQCLRPTLCPVSQHLAHGGCFCPAEGLEAESRHLGPPLEVVEAVHLAAQAVPQSGDLFVQLQLIWGRRRQQADQYDQSTLG